MHNFSQMTQAVDALSGAVLHEPLFETDKIRFLQKGEHQGLALPNRRVLFDVIHLAHRVVHRV